MEEAYQYILITLFMSQQCLLISENGESVVCLVSVTCIYSCLFLQDEVAHTLTESRVLKNTRHPFLTVSAQSMLLGQCKFREILLQNETMTVF